MSGINFLTEADVLHHQSESGARRQQTWILQTEDLVVEVWETDHNTYNRGAFRRKEDGEAVESAGGGYTGVSFKEESNVLSVGSPYFALSPGLVEFGLDRLEETDSWFVRADVDGQEEIEGEKREALAMKALSVTGYHAIGMDSDKSLFLPDYIRERVDVNKDFRRRGEDVPVARHRKIRGALRAARDMPLPEYRLHKECVIDNAVEVVREEMMNAAENAVYARPGSTEELVKVAEDAAREIANKYRERLETKRAQRRASENIEEIREDRKYYRGRLKERQEEIMDLKAKVLELEAENRDLKQKLDQGRDKITRIKGVMDLLGVSPKEAKEIVETASA